MLTGQHTRGYSSKFPMLISLITSSMHCQSLTKPLSWIYSVCGIYIIPTPKHVHVSRTKLIQLSTMQRNGADSKCACGSFGQLNRAPANPRQAISISMNQVFSFYTTDRATVCAINNVDDSTLERSNTVLPYYVRPLQLCFPKTIQLSVIAFYYQIN